MKKTKEEIRKMSEDEFWDYINRPKIHVVNEEKMPSHFNTKEEYYQYFSDAVSVKDFDTIIRDEYGM